MNATPTTRGRDALRWVLGVGLAFVLVSAMALQVARRRADERWVEVMGYFEGAINDPWEGPMTKSYFDKPAHGWLEPIQFPYSIPLAPGFTIEPVPHGGNILRAWRQLQWGGPSFYLYLRQERSVFGRRTWACMLGGEQEELAVVRTICTAASVELVEEPWPQ